MDVDYGYQDLENSEEAIEYVSDLVVRCHTPTEIARKLRSFFPGMDIFTIKKITRKAINLVHKDADKLEKKWYIAKSIRRLERLMANQNEKTKNIIALDQQLTHLLGLTENVQTESPDEIAAKIRDAVAQMDASMNIYPKCTTCKNELKEPENEQSKNNTTETGTPRDAAGTDSKETGSAGCEEGKADAEITEDEEQQLKIARMKRIKQDIKDLEK